MKDEVFLALSMRERQIMEVIYMLGEASAGAVLEHMPAPTTDASVRKLLRILEQKGHLSHRKEGREHIYRPTVAPDRVRRQAARHLLLTVFQGSIAAVVSALLDASHGDLTPEEVAELKRLIDEAEAQGR